MTRPAPKSRSSEAAGTLPSKAATILNAARIEFMKQGFAAATTDNIQRLAAVSKSTIYTHFPNKEALFAAVVAAECAELTLAIAEVKISGGGVRRRLTFIGRTYLDLILAPSAIALFRTVIAEASRFPDLGSIFYDAGPKRVIDLVTAQIEREVMAGALFIEPLSPRIVAEQFLAMVRSDSQMKALSKLTEDVSASDRDRTVAGAVNALLRAYGP